MKAKRPAKREVDHVLEIARVQLRDMLYGYDKDNLIEPLRVTINRINVILGDMFDVKSGETIDDKKD